jgi:predicted regulator of Ras-like GTPase activity (Roadblock/LC7/MglB family)
MRLPGAIAVGLVDMEVGRCIAGAGIERLDLDAMACGNTNILRSEMRLLQELDIRDEIEELLVSCDGQVHLIRPVRSKGTAGIFLFVALDAAKTNLGMARFQFARIEQELVV